MGRGVPAFIGSFYPSINLMGEGFTSDASLFLYPP